MTKKQTAKVEDGILIAAVNKKARRDYEIIDTFEAGISLLGSEVKSVRAGGVNLKDSYVRIKNGELFLVGCHISPYKFAPVDAYQPERERKLLMHRQEIDRLTGKVQEKGLSIVPLKIYFKKGRLKVEIASGRGKKMHDKREDIKTREANRKLAGVLKRNNS